MAPKNFLNNITIPAPCTADWDSMIGNDQVRFCEHCTLEVHNLSLLTRNQAQRLVARSKGRLCIRYHHDSTGRPITLPVRQKLRRIGRRVSRLAAGAFTATLSVTSAVAQDSANSQSGNWIPPNATQPQVRWAVGSSIVGHYHGSEWRGHIGCYHLALERRVAGGTVCKHGIRRPIQDRQPASECL